MKRNILVPLITPFNKDYSVNYKKLKELVEFNLNKGADGFYVGGSSAECFLLTIEERKKILETVIIFIKKYLVNIKKLEQLIFI